MSDDVSPPRLTARLRVQAILRQAALNGSTAMQVRRGDPDAGTILIKLNYLDGRFALYTPFYQSGLEPVWRCASGAEPTAETDIDALVERHIRRDSDLWVIEIENRHGTMPVQTISPRESRP